MEMHYFYCEVWTESLEVMRLNLDFVFLSKFDFVFEVITSLMEI
jgi:hypothetical protein